MAQEKESSSITSAWLNQHADLYISVIRAPFILAIRNGTLDFKSYTRWLEQDYIFVKSFVRYLASVLAKAPASTSDEEVDALLGGLNALQDELKWFRSQASKCNLELQKTASLETTERYCKLLIQLSQPQVEYPAALAALWIIEAVYNSSFATCLEKDAKTPPELQEACGRWGNAEFGIYCALLREFADQALQAASPAIRDKAEGFFEQILMHEVEFWSMAHDDVCFINL
jgi:thiaminase